MPPLQRHLLLCLVFLYGKPVTGAAPGDPSWRADRNGDWWWWNPTANAWERDYTTASSSSNSTFLSPSASSGSGGPYTATPHAYPPVGLAAPPSSTAATRPDPRYFKPVLPQNSSGRTIELVLPDPRTGASRILGYPHGVSDPQTTNIEAIREAVIGLSCGQLQRGAASDLGPDMWALLQQNARSSDACGWLNANLRDIIQNRFICQGENCWLPAFEGKNVEGKTVCYPCCGQKCGQATDLARAEAGLMPLAQKCSRKCCEKAKHDGGGAKFCSHSCRVLPAEVPATVGKTSDPAKLVAYCQQNMKVEREF